MVENPRLKVALFLAVLNNVGWRDGVRYLRREIILAPLQCPRDLLDVLRGDSDSRCLRDLPPGHAFDVMLPSHSSRLVTQLFIVLRARPPALPSRAKSLGPLLHHFSNLVEFLFPGECDEVKYLLEKYRAVKIAVDHAEVAEMVVHIVSAERARTGCFAHLRIVAFLRAAFVAATQGQRQR